MIWLAEECYYQASHHSYISYAFAKPPIFFNFFLLFSIFSCYPPSLHFFFSFWLLLDKCSRILPIFSEIIACLCMTIVHLKNILRENLFQQLVESNKNFLLIFQLKSNIFTQKNHSFKICELSEKFLFRQFVLNFVYFWRNAY